MVNRKFVTYEGNVLAEDRWNPSPILTCFYCDVPTTTWNILPVCNRSQDGCHELVTLVD